MRTFVAPPSALACAGVLALFGACAPAAGGGPSAPTPVAGAAPEPAAGAPATAEDTLVPPGHGTLRQDEITLSLRSDALLIKVTPLAEWVIRLTAPDTYERLAGVVRSQQEAIGRHASMRDPLLVFVSFFSYAPNVTFEPEDLQILSHGIRFRPLAIAPVTPGWGVRRLNQQETQMAVYAFDPSIDLRADLVVEYRLSRNSNWERMVPSLDEERAKVRARAGPSPALPPPTDPLTH